MRILLGIVLLLLTNSAALWAADEAKRVVALIDYIGGDYRNAVQGGKVLPTDLAGVAALATSSNDELAERIKKSFPAAPNNEVLAYLRRGLLEKKSTDPLLIARTLLGGLLQHPGEPQARRRRQNRRPRGRRDDRREGQSAGKRSKTVIA